MLRQCIGKSRVLWSECFIRIRAHRGNVRSNSSSSRGSIDASSFYSSSSDGRLIFGYGLIGDLADSSILARQGGTVVHAVVTSERNASPEGDFLPLTVDFRSRSYAVGKLPASANKRERANSDDEILAARIVDRAIRPLFPKGFVDTVQVLVTSHSADSVHDPVVVGVNAASAALSVSSQPWNGPVGCVRIGLIGGELVTNPSVSEMGKSSLDLLYAGTAERTLMIETGRYPSHACIDALID